MRMTWLVLAVFSCFPVLSFAAEEDSAWITSKEVHRQAKRLDYQACRALVEEGRILSIAELFKRVSALTDGRMLDTSLISDAGMYIYEMEVVGRDGVVRTLQVDAKSGELVQQ